MEPRADQRAAAVGECRQCGVWCDKMIEPRGCLEIGCKFLYTYDDELSGNRYMGCLNKVFKVEIDVDLFERMERTKAGYGGVKMTGAPLPQCPFTVERSYELEGPAYECVNPRFADCTESVRAFDLRKLAA